MHEQSRGKRECFFCKIQFFGKFNFRRFATVSFFAAQEERDYIISSVLEAGNAANPSAVQVAALECIVQISQEYYSFLGAYMPAVGSVRGECCTFC